ncbi:hypothetical protein DDB_G0291626 [Dictyostelium discoideum AX4]|uniref:Putative uncharacterized protein DDB_G0291626 n=1 Tax=Dictyostelium discoideum TaxID=44689 RepID=Y5447_DICDI|nr:hypothetical protein DDB_G0291626 [Dictyostelium discoideum AX4]Q54EL1.1 RecName: Full=Putative uncharacterized protein DDB_G0291626; Flags: Precursor [Dictyostelium discoideum]EAL61797.1 hypothetical protein DDB_G0291626 [Dictyostelium discoideum AX4]|eukprot:XP_635229.1 hypothetical protein DDB_G0291626 [Dictyostelium discoideum AX4]
MTLLIILILKYLLCLENLKNISLQISKNNTINNINCENNFNNINKSYSINESNSAKNDFVKFLKFIFFHAF